MGRKLESLQEVKRMFRLRLSRPAPMYMMSSRFVGRGLRLQIPDVALQKQQLKQPPLKMPATDACETSGIFNLRPWPTSPKDTTYSEENDK